MRIAIGSIFHETSHFLTTCTELDQWRHTYVHEGDELFELAGTDCEVAGMLAACQSEGAEIVPLVAARSVPGAPNSEACYAYLRRALMAPLGAALPVDGVLLALHGSMTVVGQHDPEGDLLGAVRQLVGPDMPVVSSLDIHAHITAPMVDAATALVTFAHYPHDDTYDTGARAAHLLFAALRGQTRPAMAAAKVPMLCGGVCGMTFGDAPLAHLTRRARQLEADPAILSVSVFQVHAQNDLPDMGSGGLVVTDDDPDLARATAVELAQELWQRRHQLEPELVSVATAVERARQLPAGPVLLVDTADCAGGGAAGDSVAVLRQLLDLGVSEPTLLMVVDPEAAEQCHRAGADQPVSLLLGHKLDPSWGESLHVSGTVSRLLDGSFTYTGGAFSGARASMGPSAVLAIGSIRVLIMSTSTYDWADEQFQAAGLDVRQARFVGVKNPMNFNFAYGDVSRGAFILNTPGPTPATVRHLPYRRMQRPFFPLDDDIPGLQPVVLGHP